MNNPKVAIIGAGVVGTALGTLLHRKGFPVVGVASRRMASAEAAVKYMGAGRASTDLAETAGQAEVVILTTPDGAIVPVCEEIARQKGFKAGATVIHCCGAHSAAVLEAARTCGARVLSIHPLQTLADRDQAVANLPGSFFALDGDTEAMDLGKKIIGALGGSVMVIPSEGKMLYHAAAVVACNYFVALVHQALLMFEAVGIEGEQGLPALMPLIQGTVRNLERVGVPKALTGPIARGDVKTIEGHLNAFDQFMPDGKKVYAEMGKVAADVAEAKGSIDKEMKQRLVELLNQS
ncbi:MAG: Rossmann-like and DUF2520 domain-containing protein [bacterium]|nr:Rossmann-like and DUF2520 domain-containing protein [bacterium]